MPFYLNQFKPYLKKAAFFLLMVSCASLSFAQKTATDTIDAFREQAFSGAPQTWRTLWVTKSLRAEAEKILGHSFNGVRLRYWGQLNRTAWVFDEIGKERPITIGVVVDHHKIDQVQVLTFRESRGGEIRYPFFTDQFVGLGLSADENEPYLLDNSIDGISGATLSVRAVKKVAALALFFHQQTDFGRSKVLDKRLAE